MKTSHTKAITTLLALLLGGLFSASIFAVTPDPSTGSTEAPASSSTTGSSSSSGSEPGMSGESTAGQDSLMQDKIQRNCKTADKNKDGYISKTEFKSLKKTAKLDFKAADTNKRGRLDMQDCVKALTG